MRENEYWVKENEYYMREMRYYRLDKQYNIYIKKNLKKVCFYYFLFIYLCFNSNIFVYVF